MLRSILLLLPLPLLLFLLLLAWVKSSRSDVFVLPNGEAQKSQGRVGAKEAPGQLLAV